MLLIDVTGEHYEWTEVVGESFYRDHLATIRRLIDGDAKRMDGLPAILRLDDDNPHDANAVSVWIADGKVGHLSREDAVEFREDVELYLDDVEAVAVWAQIRGARVREDGEIEGNIGVVLKFRLPILPDEIQEI